MPKGKKAGRDKEARRKWQEYHFKKSGLHFAMVNMFKNSIKDISARQKRNEISSDHAEQVIKSLKDAKWAHDVAADHQLDAVAANKQDQTNEVHAILTSKHSDEVSDLARRIGKQADDLYKKHTQLDDMGDDKFHREEVKQILKYIIFEDENELKPMPDEYGQVNSNMTKDKLRKLRIDHHLKGNVHGEKSAWHLNQSHKSPNEITKGVKFTTGEAGSFWRKVDYVNNVKKWHRKMAAAESEAMKRHLAVSQSAHLLLHHIAANEGTATENEFGAMAYMKPKDLKNTRLNVDDIEEKSRLANKATEQLKKFRNQLKNRKRLK